MPSTNKGSKCVLFVEVPEYVTLLKSNSSIATQRLEKLQSLVLQNLSKYNGVDLGGSLAGKSESGVKGWLKGPGSKALVQPHELLLQFDAPLNAVNYAIELQRKLDDYNTKSPVDMEISIKMGLHQGVVTLGADQPLGEAVSLASRIAALASTHGAFISKSVRDSIPGNAEFSLIARGVVQIGTKDDTMEVFEVRPSRNEARENAEEDDTKRLAVLPLVSISPDAKDEYIADGLTEEMISAVSGIGGLNIISRTSAMSFKGTSKKVSEIGKELRVGSVLEGSVRKVGNRIRITVQHIETKTDRHLWSQTYDRDLGDVFAVQSDIAKQVAEKLSVKILPHEKRIIEKELTGNPEAHLLYLKGRQYSNQRSRNALLNAISHMEKAVALDPRFALAYSGLADCYGIMLGWSFLTLDEALPKEKEYALKAVELDDLSAEAHTSMATVLMNEFQWAAAEKELKRAIELNPNYSIAHSNYAVFLSYFRRYDEALREASRAEQLDPLSPTLPALCARIYLDVGVYELAEQKAKRSLVIQPDTASAFFALFIAHRRRGKWEECSRDLDKMESCGFEPKFVKALRGVVFAGLGRPDEARKILREISEAHAYEPQFENASHIDLCLALGEHEKAVQLVRSAYRRSPILTVIASEKTFESLRQDPRVQEVLKKVGLPP